MWGYIWEGPSLPRRVGILTLKRLIASLGVSACVLGVSFGASPSIAQVNGRSAELIAQADAENGRALFQVCRPCHDVGRFVKNKSGPALNNLIGSPVGHRPGYQSSFIMLYFGVAGNVWTEELLLEYIANPQEFLSRDYAVANSSMSPFVGLEDEKDRADLVAFLIKYGDVQQLN